MIVYEDHLLAYLEDGFVVAVGPVDRVKFEENASGVFGGKVNVSDLAVAEEDGNRREEDDHPGDQDGGDGVPLGPDRHRSDGVHDGEETVQRHQDEGVDARVSRHEDEVLDHLAPDVAEGPERQDVIGGRERDAEHDEEEVGDGEVDDEEVGGRPHLLVGGDDDDDEGVAEKAEDDDDAEEERHDDGHDVLHEDFGLRVLFLGGGAVAAERREHFARVERDVGAVCISECGYPADRPSATAHPPYSPLSSHSLNSRPTFLTLRTQQHPPSAHPTPHYHQPLSISNRPSFLYK